MDLDLNRVFQNVPSEIVILILGAFCLWLITSLERQSIAREIPPYEIIIFWSSEDNAFLARVPELGNITTHGKTREEALAMAKEAIALYLDSMEFHGETPPNPKSQFQQEE